MALQRVTLRLTELRCIAQSEGSEGSEPYLWVTYFAFGAQQIPGQTGPVTAITPAYDAFRTEFPNNVKAGKAVTIPPFISTASFDMDLDPGSGYKMVGCIAVLMEEDATPDKAIIPGRIAYSVEIEKQLNDLFIKRVQAGDTSPIKDVETKAIGDAVYDKVYGAIKSHLTLWQKLFGDQDDNLGFTYRGFSKEEIAFQYFDFPEIAKKGDSSNRFVLTGSLSLGPVPTGPVDRCASPRAALKAKKDEIASLQTRVTLLQNMLHHATPQQKAGIVAEIAATNAKITQAEATLPTLQIALDACISHVHPGHAGANIDPTIVVTPD